MYTKSLTYTDFRGNTRTEDFYFNVTVLELMRWVNNLNLGTRTYSEFVNDMAMSGDSNGIMSSIEDLIHLSYGTPSEDGVQFIKSEQVQRRFFESNAYQELFVQLVTDPKARNEFFDGIFDGKLEDALNRMTEAGKKAEAEKQQEEALKRQIAGSVNANPELAKSIEVHNTYVAPNPVSGNFTAMNPGVQTNAPLGGQFGSTRMTPFQGSTRDD